MAQYCSLVDLQSLLPDNIVIGTNLMADNVSILETDATYWIVFASNLIDSHLSNMYRVPLIQVKTLDYSVANPTLAMAVDWPEPIRLICTRLAAGHLYDELINANQEPNVSEWGQNQRNMAHEELIRIESGIIRLKGQIHRGHRFVRKELLDDPRVSRPGEMAVPQRASGK